MVYQNGNGETQHLRLEEAAMGIEASQRKYTTRRLLFTGLIVTLLLVFGGLAGLVVRVQHGRSAGRPEAVATNALHKLDELSSSSSISAGCETTVLILRHCEKQGPSVADKHGNQHCSYLGHERAHSLPTLFGAAAAAAAGLWPTPSLLYALSEKRGHHVNYREIETLTPLANKLGGLEINSAYSTAEPLADDVFAHLSAGALCGQTVLVSWKHSLIPDLARALGCADCPGVFPDEFDPVWQLKFVYDVLGTAIFKQHYDSNSNNDDKRELKKHKTRSISPPQWTVFSTLTKQNFDPLRFSHTSGDYEGSPMGGKWMSSEL
jgi:hypothetical protein